MTCPARDTAMLTVNRRLQRQRMLPGTSHALAWLYCFHMSADWTRLLDQANNMLCILSFLPKTIPSITLYSLTILHNANAHFLNYHFSHLIFVLMFINSLMPQSLQLLYCFVSKFTFQCAVTLSKSFNGCANVLSLVCWYNDCKFHFQTYFF